MGKCKTCKWWNHWNCEHPTVDTHSENSMSAGGFTREHFEPFTKVGPEFGCIHHEPKDKQDDKN